MKLLMLDNRDSFVYNLVNELREVTSEVQVYRNNIAAERFVDEAEKNGAVICLSPGPGTPESAGCMMDVIRLGFARKLPMVGICLGFQALAGVCGANIERVGPVHGQAYPMELTACGKRVFNAVGRQSLQIGRYHSLGTYNAPDGWEIWGTCNGIIMAGGNREKRCAGVQFHPESVLTAEGKQILSGLIDFVR